MFEFTVMNAQYIIPFVFRFETIYTLLSILQWKPTKSIYQLHHITRINRKYFKSNKIK